MYRAINEYPARELGIRNEESGGIEFVACLGTDYAGTPDCACEHFGVCVAVGGVEASAEAAEDFEMWFAVCCVEDTLRLFQSCQLVGRLP